jgi:GTP cyclohydrolase FolE2
MKRQPSHRRSHEWIAKRQSHQDEFSPQLFESLLHSLQREPDRGQLCRPVCRNGSNPMFVEDAVRSLRHGLQPRYTEPIVRVKHMESLHPHDAFAELRVPPLRDRA